MHRIVFFLIGVVIISLSGVMMPGPVLAATIAKGYESGKSGILISIGHGIIEFPLMLLIFLGMLSFLSEEMKTIIGILGGGALIYLGINMIRSKEGERDESFPYPSIFLGFITSASNPYFFLWWVTVGAALIVASMEYGTFGFLMFAITHWMSDLGWYSFVSFSVNRSRNLWSEKTKKIIFSTCGLILIGFGIYFLISVMQT